MSRPSLKFLNSPEFAGFTAAEITSFSKSSNASAVVRELIQNAFDASQEAQNSKAIIKFQLSSIKVANIPGIRNYRKALSEAKRYREKENDGKLNDQEQMIVEPMERALRQSELSLLSVIDNGIGLNSGSMRALLGNGTSKKSNGSGGAFGNGHFSVFPISDLRYLLYAGVSDSSRIASGHAILASHFGRSANGYYISGFNKKDGKHCYPTKAVLHEVIWAVLDDIEKQYKHGTAVLIPAFNNFRDRKIDFYDIIEEAATCNFFPVIEQNKLVVLLETDDKNSIKRSIDKNSLREIISKFKDKKHNKDFLSGHKANLAYHAMKHGGLHEEVKVLDGKMSIYLETPSPAGNSKINLFRNGMWITNNEPGGGLPGFNNKFGNYQSFEAVLLVTAEGAPKFHDLIRKAETSLHNQLNIKLMSSGEAKILQECFNLIRERLMELVPEISNEKYRPSHLLGIETETNGTAPSKYAHWIYHGSIATTVPAYQGMSHTSRESATDHKTTKQGKKSRKRNHRRIHRVLPSVFDVVARPKGKNRKQICIHSHEDCSDMLLRLVVDENTDSTTDGNVWPPYHAEIVSAKSDGQDISEQIVDDPYSGIRINKLNAGEDIMLDVRYKINGVTTASILRPSLRVVLQRATTDVRNNK